jgi:Ca2+:H+ antiporter
VIFVCSLLSVVPLAYFIGTAVSSITAQTGSLAVGAVINATFGSIVEITLYALALRKGKERMVEGSIIGSFLCGILALPGASMLSGGIMRKEQRFNARSAGVTSTMIIMAIIGAFTPTLFQQIYGLVVC